MSLLRAYAAFITGAVLGWGLPVSMPHVAAAPGDVRGSANVALDSYRNRSGSFVLWGSGRITRSDGSNQDLGYPYTTPAPAARLATPTPVPHEPLGATWLPVKALVRSDGTYILFSDGTLRRPAHSDAAAGAPSGGGGVITGAWNLSDFNSGAPRDLGACTIRVLGGQLQVTVDQPLSGPCEGFAIAYGSYYSYFHPMPSGAQGSSFVIPLNRTPLQMTGGYFMIRERR